VAVRTPWTELPRAVQQAARDQLGADYTATDVTGGAGSHTAAVLAASDRRVFVKGVRADAVEVEDLDAEERVSPYLPSCAPRVLWRLHVDGWHILASEAVTGGIAEYEPGSPHLPLIVDALDQAGSTPAPDIDLYTSWFRWGYWCEPSDEPLFDGDRLLHTDPAATNFLVGDRAWLVDWSWATRGPAWIDPALWAIRLISDGGQTPEQAWEHASRVTAFRAAPRRGLAALAAAEATRWEECQAEGTGGIALVTKAAREWADYVDDRRPD